MPSAVSCSSPLAKAGILAYRMEGVIIRTSSILLCLAKTAGTNPLIESVNQDLIASRHKVLRTAQT